MIRQSLVSVQPAICAWGGNPSSPRGLLAEFGTDRRSVYCDADTVAEWATTSYLDCEHLYDVDSRAMPELPRKLSNDIMGVANWIEYM